MNINEYIASGIIEMYVMGLCSPEEEQEVEMLKLKHPELQTAITAFELQMEKNMMQQVVNPGTGTDEKILKELDSLSQLSNVAKKNVATVKRINWWRYAAAACFLLLLGSGWYNFLQYKKTERLKDIVAAPRTSPLPLADYEIITNPSITPVAMYGVGSHAICRCTMFWDKKSGKAYIMIHHLPKSSNSKDYQLWAEVNGKPVSVGIINDEIRGRFIEVPNIPGSSVAFTVTLENAGGTTAPTVSETYLQGKI
jgi:anti-sigma-K factor RskA